jgi:polygalacturonase
MKTPLPAFALFFAVALAANAAVPPAATTPVVSGIKNVFNVRDSGAKGDGTTKDTAALQKALDACAAAGGGEVFVPAGHYLTGSLVLGSNTTLQLDQKATLTGSPDAVDYPLEQGRFEGEFTSVHRALISANKADHVAITGPGTLVGPPVAVAALRKPRGPVMIELTECNGVRLEDFTVHYQRLWSVHPLLCKDVDIRHVTIRSSLTNGDGIDVDSCNGVVIEQCDIEGGDDAISLKSGRGLAAMKMDRPTENVVIRDCKLASSNFAAIGFGTEMSGGIRHIQMVNCTLSGRQNGIYIKSRDGRGGYMEDISGDNLTVSNSPTFLGFDLATKGIQAVDPVPGDTEKWARVAGLKFTNIKVSNVADLVVAGGGRVTPAMAIPAARPIDGFLLANITGTCRRGITLANVVHADFSGIKVTGFAGSLLNLTNVTGTGLEAVAPR